MPVGAPGAHDAPREGRGHGVVRRDREAVPVAVDDGEERATGQPHRRRGRLRGENGDVRVARDASRGGTAAEQVGGDGVDAVCGARAGGRATVPAKVPDRGRRQTELSDEVPAAVGDGERAGVATAAVGGDLDGSRVLVAVDEGAHVRTRDPHGLGERAHGAQTDIAPHARAVGVGGGDLGLVHAGAHRGRPRRGRQAGLTRGNDAAATDAAAAHAGGTRPGRGADLAVAHGVRRRRAARRRPGHGEVLNLTGHAGSSRRVGRRKCAREDRDGARRRCSALADGVDRRERELVAGRISKGRRIGELGHLHRRARGRQRGVDVLPRVASRAGLEVEVQERRAIGADGCAPAQVDLADPRACGEVDRRRRRIRQSRTDVEDAGAAQHDGASRSGWPGDRGGSQPRCHLVGRQCATGP